MCRPSTIAIDGPAASGKSTLGYYLAQRLSYLYLDTGVLYRAVTWAALQQGVAITDEARITLLAEEVKIDVFPPAEEDGRQYTVRIGNPDITWAIRTPDVDRAVSPVSAYPGVRAALTRQLRRIAAPGHVVMVGVILHGRLADAGQDSSSLGKRARRPAGSPAARCFLL